MSSSTSNSNRFTIRTKRNAGIIGRQAAVIAAASGLVLSGAMAANAAEVPAERNPVPASSVDVTGQLGAPLTADASVQISFERPAVASTPAPVIEQPTPVAAAAPAAVVAQAPAAPKAAVKVQAAPAPAAAPAAVAPAAVGRGAALLASAYAQLGITQDCTAMVEKALGAAGKPVGDLGPQQFLGQGTVVATPAPGDIVVQSGHVGIYAGNGQVISGGMNYVNATMVHPLSWLTATGGVTFVRA
jgi:cell wall-associated NlpC family hydrolase